MSLFNADDYTSPNDKPSKRKRRKPSRKPEHISDGMWHVVTTTNGPLAFCHRLDPFAPSTFAASGSVLTRCEQVGRLLHTPPTNSTIHACPICYDRAR